MTDNSGDRIPGTFLLKLGSYLVSSRLATYCSNMVTHKYSVLGRTLSAMVATVVPRTPVVYETVGLDLLLETEARG